MAQMLNRQAVPYTDAAVDAIQSRMANLGFTVPVRVISEGLLAALPVQPRTAPDEAKLLPPAADKQRAREALAVELAIVIADHAARSDVELHAKRLPNEWFDLSDGEPMGKASKADRTRAAKKAGIAAAYIDLRASELPYLMLRDPQHNHFVRFANRPVGGGQ